ncbi:hypothetical protein PIB30_041693 [Stylosanthes scabra]|uniref:Uncharacterized protein n=1 Tax=Stylosanthes scabra TaxID=79078 RepID=A0ABU6VHW2_9FABA|nr:hypothetical protein [Stylosanthes scabra]
MTCCICNPNINIIQIVPKGSHLLKSNEKEQKEAWKARKEENRATGQKQSYSDSNRGLTPRRHYPRLGVAEPPPFNLIQHPTRRRDARRLGVDEAARKMTLLHQGLNA